MNRVRLATLLCPPAGWVLLWRQHELSPARRLLGSLGIGLYCIPYVAAWIFLLVRFAGLQVEFRGGMVPAFTWTKTLPDYDAVESDRARSRAGTGSTNSLRDSGSYWAGFRGPQRDGRYEEQPVLTNWPAGGPPCLWRQPVGGGYASVVVAGGRVFTLEQRRDQEAATAYDLETGRELWAHAWKAEFTEALGGDGPRATPVWEDGRLYALGALGELRCLDATSGGLLWRTNILDQHGAANLTYGASASPLLVNELLIVTPGGGLERSVAAYDKRTGALRWHALPDEATYSSPMLVTLAGERQLLVALHRRVVGLEPATGRLLWEFPWVVLQRNRNIAQPLLLSSHRLFLSAGYGTGCVAVEVARAAAGWEAREVWRNKSLKNKFTSSVGHDGFIYGLDEDILTCLDATTGARRWKDGRYGYGQMLLASGHLVILSGSGDLALVRARPDRFEELARFPAIHGKTWNHPALAAGRLLVRNAVEMACFDLRRAPP